MILRHQVDDKNIASEETINYYQGRINKVLSRIGEGKEVDLYNLKRRPMDIVLGRLMHQKDLGVFDGLALFLDMGYAHLIRVLTRDPLVKVEINQTTYSLKSLQSRYGADIFSWYQLLNIALILRDEGKLSSLLNTTESILESENDPFWQEVMHYFHALFHEKPKARILHFDAIKAKSASDRGLFIGISETKIVEIEGRASNLTRLVRPIFELWELAIAKDVSEFNQLLEAYILDKKSYIIDNKKEKDSTYWIDFPLLACCTWAEQNGVSVTVESEYIPAWLFRKKES